MENPILFPAADFVGNQANQYINQQYTDYNRREDQKLYERNAKIAYGYSKKAAQDSSTAMLTGMKNAGISPATMTGGMQAFPLSSGHAPSTSSPQADNIPISKSMLAGAEFENLQAQNENLKSQNELLGSQKNKTDSEKTTVDIQNERLRDEDKHYKDSGTTFGAVKALTDYARQQTEWSNYTIQQMENAIQAKVIAAYGADKSNIDNEVLHRINTNKKAKEELAILSQTLANLEKDEKIKDETKTNLENTGKLILQELKLNKEQTEQLKDLNIKNMIDNGDYLGALLAFVIKISGGVSFSANKRM